MCWHQVADTVRTPVFEGGLYVDIYMSWHNALDSIETEGWFFKINNCP